MNEIPNGWNSGRLDSIAHIEMGQSPPGDSYNNLGEGLPLLNGPTEFTERYPIKLQWTTKPTKMCEVGDVLLCVRGSSTGRINIADDVYCIGRGIGAIRAKSNKSNSKFLEYLLYSIVQVILTKTAGSTFPNVTKKDLLSIGVIIPPLEEQRAIADILGTWDEAIALNERLIDALQERKKGLIQKLLTGEVRFPEFVESDAYKIAFGKRVPQDWKTSEFGEFAKRSSKRFNPKESDEVLPCIELEYIEQNTGRLLGCTTTEEQKSTKNCFRAGDVLFGKLRPYLNKYLQPDFEGVCSSEIWVLNGNKNYCSNDYLYYTVQSNRFLHAANVTSGTKMPRADWGYVSEFVFTLPLPKEQEKIVSVFKETDKEVTMLGQFKELLQQQKKGLMQQLLTGQVRVKV